MTRRASRARSLGSSRWVRASSSWRRRARLCEGHRPLAKTDALDADGLALFAERVRPTPRPLPDATVQALEALITRRRQLLDMLTAERNRLEHAVGPIRRGLTDHIRWLERRVADVDRDLDQTIATSPAWRATDDLLQSIPGVGPVVRLR